MESKFKESQPTIQFIQASLRRMAAEITTLLDSKDGHAILLTQIITERPTSTQKHIAYLDMRRVNNGTLGLELSQARTVQIHQIDCSSTCLQITNVLMDSDGTSSPAMAAGLKKGDIITRCGRTPVTSIQSLLDNVRQAQKDKMKFLVLEYCRLPRFGFLQRDIENARAQVEEKCYQVGRQPSLLSSLKVDDLFFSLCATFFSHAWPDVMVTGITFLQTRLNVMLEQHVNNEELRNLSPSELYALFPSPFSRSGGCVCLPNVCAETIMGPVARFNTIRCVMGKYD